MQGRAGVKVDEGGGGGGERPLLCCYCGDVVVHLMCYGALTSHACCWMPPLLSLLHLTLPLHLAFNRASQLQTPTQSTTTLSLTDTERQRLGFSSTLQPGASHMQAVAGGAGATRPGVAQWCAERQYDAREVRSNIRRLVALQGRLHEARLRRTRVSDHIKQVGHRGRRRACLTTSSR